MSHYDINYTNIEDRKAKDAKACRDSQEYLGSDRWPLMLYQLGRAEGRGTAAAFKQVDMAMCFAGIQGFPNHALGRTYCLTAYRAWMHSGDDAVMTDEEGFALPTQPAAAEG